MSIKGLQQQQQQQHQQWGNLERNCFVFALSAPHKATANLAGHYLAVLCLTLYGEPCAR